MTGSKLWTRSFVIISLVNFLVGMSLLLLMIVVTKVATDRFDASPALAGLSASIFTIGAFVTRPICGKWLHQVGQARMVYTGAILNLALTLLYFAANSNTVLLVIRLLHGAAFGTMTLATATIVAHIVPRERYGEGIGYFTLGQTMATAIGPFLGLLLLRHGSFNTIIIVCASVSAIGLLLLPLASVKNLELTEEQLAETKGFKLRNFVEPKVIPIGLTVMATFICSSSVTSFLALYSEDIQLTRAASVFFIVYAAVMFVTRPLIGRRFDVKGENSVMYPALIIFALSLAIYSQARHGLVLLMAAAIMGVGFGAVQSSGRVISIKITAPHRVGQATSTFYIFGDIGLGVGPLLCGLLVPSTGYRGAYVIMAVLAVLCLPLYHVLYGRRARPGLRPSHADTAQDVETRGPRYQTPDSQ